MEGTGRIGARMDRKAFEMSANFDPALPTATPSVIAHPPIEVTDADPKGRLPIVPERIVPRSIRPPRSRAAAAVLTGVLVNVGFAALMALLLDWRSFPNPSERTIPVEIVASMPEAPKPPPPPTPVAAEAPPPRPPPPPEARDPGSSDPRDGMAPPPEPMRAETQSVRTAEAVPTPEPPRPEPVPPAAAPQAEAPAVLASEQGTFAAAPPQNAPSPAKPPVPAPTPPKAKPPVDLATILPMDLDGLPSTFRSVLSGSGAQATLEYRGVVLGRVQRSHKAAEEAAARRLSGQVTVSFGIDERGQVVDLRIGQSSGKPAVDAIALAMVREAEPFPPPPAGADRIFNPGLLIGQ